MKRTRKKHNAVIKAGGGGANRVSGALRDLNGTC